MPGVLFFIGKSVFNRLRDLHLNGVAEKSSNIPVLSGFVLAGGKSRRMGRDKSTLQFRDRSLLEHMVQLLSTVANPVRVVGRGALFDRIPDSGPLGGILTALETSKSPMNLMVAVDLPLLSPEFLKWFASRLTRSVYTVVACQVRNNFPLCIGVHQNAQTLAARKIAEGDLTVHRFIREASAEIVSESEIQSAGFLDSLFCNFNTPEQWDPFNR